MITRNVYHSKTNTAVTKNERLTAITGIVLFVLIVIELITTMKLHALISVHIFIGVLLSGPLVVKLCSTGYRFLKYYTKSQVFVKKGPPNFWLRLLAPFFVFITFLVFLSGFWLAVRGPTHLGLMFKIHAASVALWIPLLAVHVYAYLRKAFLHMKNDWSSRASDRVNGRNGRLYTNIGSLLLGAIAAIIMISVSASWDNWRIQPGIPSPIILGVIAAVFAVIIIAPLLHKVRKTRTLSE